MMRRRMTRKRNRKKRMGTRMRMRWLRMKVSAASPDYAFHSLIFYCADNSNHSSDSDDEPAAAAKRRKMGPNITVRVWCSLFHPGPFSLELLAFSFRGHQQYGSRLLHQPLAVFTMFLARQILLALQPQLISRPRSLTPLQAWAQIRTRGRLRTTRRIGANLSLAFRAQRRKRSSVQQCVAFLVALWHAIRFQPQTNALSWQAGLSSSQPRNSTSTSTPSGSRRIQSINARCSVWYALSYF